MNSLHFIDETERESDSSNSELGSPNIAWNSKGSSQHYGQDSIDLNKFFERMTFQDLYNDFTEEEREGGAIWGNKGFKTNDENQRQSQQQQQQSQQQNLFAKNNPFTNITNFQRDTKQINKSLKNGKKKVRLGLGVSYFMQQPLSEVLINKVSDSIISYSEQESLLSFPDETFDMFPSNGSRFSLFSN